QIRFVDSPDRRDVLPVLRIADIAPAGQLVALLAMFPSALSVGLTSDRAVAALRLADPPSGQHEIDRAKGVLDAARMLLDTPCVKQKTGLGRAPPFCRLTDRSLRDAGHLRGTLWRPVAAIGGDLIEPHGQCVDERVIEPIVLDHEMENAGKQCCVASG